MEIRRARCRKGQTGVHRITETDRKGRQQRNEENNEKEVEKDLEPKKEDSERNIDKDEVDSSNIENRESEEDNQVEEESEENVIDEVSEMEKEIINNIASANDKNFEEETSELDFSNDETMTNDIVDDVTLESSIVRAESNVLSKKDLKRLAKEQKKLREQAQKEFLDDKTFVNSAFDKYVREETEVLPRIDEKSNKKTKKKEK